MSLPWECSEPIARPAVEEGAWAASEEWWGKDQEIAMCHEFIGEVMALLK